MRHKLTILISLAIVVVMSFVAVAKHDSYKAWARVQSAKTAAVQQAKAKVQAHKEAEQQETIKLLQAQCLKDLATYNAMTPAQRPKGSVAPVCGLPAVQ